MQRGDPDGRGIPAEERICRRGTQSQHQNHGRAVSDARGGVQEGQGVEGRRRRRQPQAATQGKEGFHLAARGETGAAA